MLTDLKMDVSLKVHTSVTLIINVTLGSGEFTKIWMIGSLLSLWVLKGLPTSCPSPLCQAPLSPGGHRSPGPSWTPSGLGPGPPALQTPVAPNRP